MVAERPLTTGVPVLCFIADGSFDGYLGDRVLSIGFSKEIIDGRERVDHDKLVLLVRGYGEERGGNAGFHE